jgi:hypothetical protein
MHTAKTKCCSLVHAQETVLMYTFIDCLYDPHRYTGLDSAAQDSMSKGSHLTQEAYCKISNLTSVLDYGAVSTHIG